MEEDSDKAPPIVTLDMEGADGTRESVTLTGPGGAVRVAVGRPGCRGSVWRVWANRGKSDVYVAARVLGRDQKFSLHESGDWRYQKVRPRQAEAFTANPGRIIDRWPRPDEVTGGWTKGLSIWIPHEDLSVDDDDDQTEEGVTWLPEPAEGWAAGIHVVVAKPDRGSLTLEDAVPVEAFTLANGEVVIVLASSSAVSPAKKAELDGLRDQVVRRTAHIDMSDVAIPRMLIFGYEGAGHRFVWDLSVRW